MSFDDQLTAAYHRRLLMLRARAAATVGSIFDRFAGPSDQALEEYVRHAAPILAGARVGSVQIMAGYLAGMLGDAPRVDQVAVLASIRGGVALDEVLARPIITMRTKLAEGLDFFDSENAARARATSTAETDVMLANRGAAVNGMENEPRIVGYRRVLSGKTCAFCAAASTQRYRSSDLMPLHVRCDCGIAPIVGTRDPGQVVNRKLLRDLKEQGGSKYWEGRYKVDEDGTIVNQTGGRLDVAVHEHGELGPVLADERHIFTGADDF